MSLPLAVVRSGAERTTVNGTTKNISSSGVLFTSGREPDLGGPIEYIITLSHDGPAPVNLRCVGKVLRSECLHIPESKNGSSYEIAATLERYEFVRDR